MKSTSHYRRATYAACVCGLMALAINSVCGCNGSSLPLAPVTGTVAYKGQSLEHGMVVFIPEQGTPGPQAVGTIQSDGTFRIHTLQSDGAAVGWHTVLVHCRDSAPREQSPGIPPASSSKPLIPRQYSVEAETPLRFEVKEGRNAYAIALE